VTRSRAVLFDFDGTLADTAPDLAAAVNRLRMARGLAALAADEVRPFCSMGARGLLRVGFGLSPEDPGYAELRDAFLERYGESVCVDTRLFPGIQDLLRALEGRAIPWGVVTNKARRFTERILPVLGVRPACLVCGDSTPHLKPHPAPLLLAAEQLQLHPGECVYLGDDLRDMQAARAAGMRAVAVEYGYAQQPHAWNADLVIAQPMDLLLHL
jgi:N-acetyl-D-muramate 6-phosphate phosphatase